LGTVADGDEHGDGALVRVVDLDGGKGLDVLRLAQLAQVEVFADSALEASSRERVEAAAVAGDVGVHGRRRHCSGNGACVGGRGRSRGSGGRAFGWVRLLCGRRNDGETKGRAGGHDPRGFDELGVGGDGHTVALVVLVLEAERGGRVEAE